MLSWIMCLQNISHKKERTKWTMIIFIEVLNTKDNLKTNLKSNLT